MGTQQFGQCKLFKLVLLLSAGMGILVMLTDAIDSVEGASSCVYIKFSVHFPFSPVFRMKPRKVKEDDAPRTIACPHKVSKMGLL